MKLPVIRAFGASYAFFFANFANVLRVAWLPFLLIALAYGWELSVVGKALSHTIVLGPHSSDNDRHAAIELIRQLAPLQRWNIIIGVAIFVLVCVVNVGVLKPILRGAWPRGSFYLGFGKDELRVIGAKFIVAVLIGVVAFGSILGIGVVGGLLAAINPTVGGIVAAAAGVTAFVVIIWLMLRLSLVAPASVGTNYIGFEQSWSVTEGNVWKLFLYWILVALPVIALWSAIVGLLMAGMLPEIAARLNDVEQAPDMMPKRETVAVVWRLISILIGAGSIVSATALLVNIIGAGFAYKLMTED